MGRHGIYITEEATDVSAAVNGASGIPVVIGIAPINMAADPDAVTNKPVLVHSAAEARKLLGYDDDLKTYTLCQMIYAMEKMHPVAPVVFINVLDLTKNKKNFSEEVVDVVQNQATLKKKGVIRKGLTVKKGSAEFTNLTIDTDYTLSYDADGYLVVTLTAAGAEKAAGSVKIGGDVVDASTITKKEIIGAVDPVTGAESGIQLVRQVYPKFGVVPGFVLAPGFSHEAEVGAALSASAELINGVFKAMAIVDLDTTKTKVYTAVKEQKEAAGFTAPN